MIRAHAGRHMDDHAARLYDDGIPVHRLDRRGVSIHLHRHEHYPGSGLPRARGAAPTIELLGHQPVATRYFRDVRSRTQRLFDDPPLCLGRPTPPPARPAKHLQPTYRRFPTATAFETNFVIKHVSYPRTLRRGHAIADVDQLRNVGVIERLPFNRFLFDGRLEPDNLIAERAIRGFTVGRRNWLFAGYFKAAERAAVILTIIETC